MHQIKAAPRQDRQVLVVDLLDRLQSELSELAGLSDGLQQLAGTAIDTMRDPERGAFITQIQTADLLTQSLHGLSAFLGALKQSMPAHWTVDLAHAEGVLTLSSLARRLRGETLEKSDDGDVCLF